MEGKQTNKNIATELLQDVFNSCACARTRGNVECVSLSLSPSVTMKDKNRWRGWGAVVALTFHANQRLLVWKVAGERVTCFSSSFVVLL